MTPELFAALFIALMIPINAIVSGTAHALVAGFGWGFGNRDTKPEMPPWAMRLERAYSNLLETAPAFLAVVIIAHVVQVHTAATVIGAWTFVFARLVFVGLYTGGVTFLALRTVVWFTSLGGLVAIAFAILQHADWPNLAQILTQTANV